MANYEATRYDINGSNLTSIEGVNTGIIIPWSSASIPAGFLECDGQSVSTSTFAALFAVIAYTYGGSGASFNVPNLTDKCCVSTSNTKNLAQTGGANTIAITGNVGGTAVNTTLTSAQLPTHLHTTANAGNTSMAQSPGGGTQGLFDTGNTTYGNTGGGAAHTHNLSANFTGSSMSTLQPFLVLIYIIKT